MNIKWGSSPSINEHLRSKPIGSDFETVRGTVSKSASMGVSALVSKLPKPVQRALAEVRFSKRKIMVYTKSSFTMYSAGDDGAKGFTALVNLETNQVSVTWGSFGGGGLGQKPSPVDDTNQPKQPLPDHLVVVQGQIGGRDPYASVTCTPETLPLFMGGAPSIKVASLGDLSGFLRVSSNLLIHKSTNDLWNVSKTADGSFEVSRLFDDDGSPLKG
jgi:hypothetical protein